MTYGSRTDPAWIVCLHKAGVLDQATAARVLCGVEQLELSYVRTKFCLSRSRLGLIADFSERGGVLDHYRS